MCETDSDTTLPEYADGEKRSLVLEKEKRYGAAFVYFLTPCEEDV